MRFNTLVLVTMSAILAVVGLAACKNKNTPVFATPNEAGSSSYVFKLQCNFPGENALKIPSTPPIISVTAPYWTQEGRTWSVVDGYVIYYTYTTLEGEQCARMDTEVSAP